MIKKSQLSSPKKKTAGKSSPSLSQNLDQWCRKYRPGIILAIIAVSLALRIVYFQQTCNTHFVNEHINHESDMSFFHLGAVKIADGDLLSKTVSHPEHQWMKWVSDRYFQAHPEKLEQFRVKIGNDTLANNPGKMLWEEWYGKQTFQQEPLYPYFVAMNYAFFGTDVRWVFIFQLFLGILTNLLIYLVTRRYFGDLAGTFAAFLAVLFGPMLFYEMVLLRSSIAVFIGILLIYVTGTALIKNKFSWWLIMGSIIGIALMIHAFFILYLLGMILVLLLISRGQLKTRLLFAAAVIMGFFLAISPIAYRNHVVGVPAMSMSSTTALSFITMNNGSFKSFIGWNMNTQYLSDIMGESDGKLFKAIVPTLKTHPSAASYFSQVWDKLHATFSWYEIPNNVNFYLYREYIPVLYLTFISFLILSPLAIAGMFLGLYKKINAWPLYLMILVYLFPMLAFMVLSRYRIILVPVLIPFAAFTIAQLLKPWRGTKNYLVLLAVLILGYWASITGNEKVYRITRTDYTNIWSVHYLPTVKDQVEKQQWDRVASALNDFLQKYEPQEISGASPSCLCRNANESDIFNYFSSMHLNLALLYRSCADSVHALSENETSKKLQVIASRTPLNQ